jgi:hypothetical protein
MLGGGGGGAIFNAAPSSSGGARWRWKRWKRHLMRRGLLEPQTQAVAAGAQTLPMTVHNTMAALAAQASSSFHTQAQHNYLVVALLPNQAVTSFTHLRLLTHLALCHL